MEIQSPSTNLWPLISKVLASSSIFTSLSLQMCIRDRQSACDLVDEGMITEQEAVLRVEPKQLDTLLPVSYTHLA